MKICFLKNTMFKGKRYIAESEIEVAEQEAKNLIDSGLAYSLQEAEPNAEAEAEAEPNAEAEAEAEPNAEQEATNKKQSKKSAKK